MNVPDKFPSSLWWLAKKKIRHLPEAMKVNNW